MELFSRKLIISFFGVITLLLVVSGNSYSFAEAKAVNKSSSAESKTDYLLYAALSRGASPNNYFAPTATSTCPSGSNRPAFKPGQVVSSDVFNEIFSRIDNITEGFRSSSELTGTWSCTANAIIGAIDDYCLMTGFYSRDQSNFFDTMTDIVTFKANVDGSFSYASAKYPLISCINVTPNGYVAGPAIAVPETGTYVIIKNHMMLKPDTGPNWGNADPIQSFMPLLKKSKYSFVLDISAVWGRVISCDRLDIPPIDPADLSVAVYGRSVTLTWMNICNSTATSLKVLRKDSLMGNYYVVATLSATATNYTETVPNAGTYWYRVVAANSYGDSAGSNVADAIVE